MPGLYILVIYTFGVVSARSRRGPRRKSRLVRDENEGKLARTISRTKVSDPELMTSGQS